MAEQEWRSVVPHVKCHLLWGDWLSSRADMAPDISECTCGFWSFTVVEMCESAGGPNPPSHYQFDVLQFLYKIAFLQVFALDSCTYILIPKTIGNRKRDCAWGCAWGINTTCENLQIEKHKSVRWAEQTPSWFVLFDLQIFSGGVYSPSATSRTISFSISNSFWY